MSDLHRYMEQTVNAVDEVLTVTYVQNKVVTRIFRPCIFMRGLFCFQSCVIGFKIIYLT